MRTSFTPILLLVFLVTSISYAQFTVTNNHDNGPGSFRQAVLDADATPGHNTITFNDNYTINVTSGKIVAHDDLTIIGTGAGNTILDGSSNTIYRVFGAIGFDNLEVQGITFRNSVSFNDAGAVGIKYVNTARFIDCEFYGNHTNATNGAGALGATATNLSVERCVFTGNSTINSSTTSAGALGLALSGTLTVSNSTFTNNRAHYAGGAIATNSPDDVVIINSTFTGNRTEGPQGIGGAVAVLGNSNSIFTNAIFTNNSASRQGGAIWNGNGGMSLVKTFIDANEAKGDDNIDGGGGIYNNAGVLSISNLSIISNNRTSGIEGSGGAIMNATGDVLVQNSTISNNEANHNGGAIEMVNGNLTLTNTEIIANSAIGNTVSPNSGNGGGIHLNGNNALVTIENSLISANEAAHNGGGVYTIAGNQLAINTTIVGENSTNGTTITEGGAGIYNQGGIIEIYGSTISNNHNFGTNGSGGGIHNGSNGQINIAVSTISGNSVNGSGGGIFNQGTDLTINAVTIANNSAIVNGGGIESLTVTTIKNTIVADNNAVTGIDVSGTFDSNDYNLIGIDDSNAFPEKPNDLEDANAALGPLRNNGSGMLIHELTAGSEALNAGDPNTMFVDQIGQPVFDARRDIGAFELQEFLLSVDDFGANLSEIIVYPNPSKSRAMIKIPASFGADVQITLIELGSGKTVENINTSNGVSELNLSRFSDGIYVLRLVSETTSATKRLVLSK
tara:strand:+ start:121878 stop:124076 length:2199 start_codon:yes stop_codon:yes gene_type:complete